MFGSKIATIYVENNLPVSTISDQTPDIQQQVQIKLSSPPKAAQLAAETAESDGKGCRRRSRYSVEQSDARAAAAAAAAFAAGYATSSDQARVAAVDAMCAITKEKLKSWE